MVDNYIFNLIQSFEGSFINQHGEFIVHKEANEYFNLGKCKDELEVKCKVLEWFSRGAFKTEPFRSKKANRELHAFMLKGINKFLVTDFSEQDMSVIYQYLGNGINRNLSIAFINNGFDFNILDPRLEVNYK